MLTLYFLNVVDCLNFPSNCVSTSLWGKEQDGDDSGDDDDKLRALYFASGPVLNVLCQEFSTLALHCKHMEDLGHHSLHPPY